MPPDATPEPGPHADAAGWVLSALDEDDAQAFMLHLHSCEECRTTVAELRPVAQAITRAAPALEPPADLGARTLGAAQQAAIAERSAKTVPHTVMSAKPSDETRGKKTRWWQRRWSVNPLAAVAALGATVGVVLAVVLLTVPGSKPAKPVQSVTVARFELHSPSGGPAAGQAVGTDHGAVGWSLRISVHGLQPLPSNQFYECWYVTSPTGHPKISGGTFTLGSSGAGIFTMWSAADPHTFKTMWITKRRIGEAGPGTVVLTAQARL